MSRLKSTLERVLPSSLTNRVFALYGLSLAVFVVAGLALFIQHQVRGDIEEAEAASVMLIEVVNLAVQDSVVIGDYDTVRKTLQKGVDGSVFKSATFIDMQGGRIEVTDPSQQKHGLPPAWLVDWVKQKLDDVNRPVSVGGRDYGVLRLQFDTLDVADKIWSVSLMVGGAGLLSLLAGLSLIRIPLNRWLGSMDRVRSLVEALGTGRLGPEQLALENEPTEVRRVVEMLKQTTTLLHEREAGRRALADQKFALDQHSIVSITDIQGKITYANDHFCHITGYSREELLGRSHSVINAGYHPREFFSDLWQTIGEGKVWHGEMCNRRRSGDLFWVNATIVPLIGDDGAPHHFVAIRTDITDRKTIEEALANQREFFERISETLGEGVYVLERQGCCTYMNAEAERLLGWTRADLLGTTVQEMIEIRSPEAPGNSVAAQVQDETHSDEKTYRRKDGSTFPVAVVSKPIFTTDGRQDGIVVAFQDITFRKEAEAAIVKAKEAAEQANRVKSDFLANMSHEIRTPMNGILGMTGLALDTELSEEQREYLSLIKSSADSLLHIINDILDFSKIEAGRMDIEQIEFALEPMVRDAVRSLAVRAHQKNLELLVHIGPDVPELVVGDPGRLRQVLVNLVGNAIKFTAVGEVEVRVERLNDVAEATAQLCFSVRDTGIGIPPEKRQAVFEAFAQADTSTTRHYGGTGLGLAICIQLAALMDGYIDLDSAVGVGSTFSLTLNLPVAASARPVPTKAIGGIAGLPVLIVDDNATNRRLLEQMLRNMTMRPVSVDGAQQALLELERAAAAGTPYALAVLDVQMPGMDGFSLVEQLRRDQRQLVATVMMLTSQGQRGDGARCRELGVASYLTKPISQPELFEAIMTALGVPRETHQALITRHSLRESRRRLELLLAEDNAINQTLGVRLLEKLGHGVTVAKDGLEAVDAWRSGRFDAILMDVDMPRMNGYEATECIRREEQRTGGHIPIIAMTAHAMRGAREECLSHGMDGYLTKPIDTQLLWRELDSLAQTDRGDNAAVESPDRGGSDHESIANFAQARQSMDQDRALFEELAQMLVRDAPAHVTMARQALAAGDESTVQRAAHSIKGMVSMFAALRATEAASRLEQVAGDEAQAAGALAELEAAMDEFMAALQAYRW